MPLIARIREKRADTRNDDDDDDDEGRSSEHTTQHSKQYILTMRNLLSFFFLFYLFLFLVLANKTRIRKQRIVVDRVLVSPRLLRPLELMHFVRVILHFVYYLTSHATCVCFTVTEKDNNISFNVLKNATSPNWQSRSRGKHKESGRVKIKQEKLRNSTIRPPSLQRRECVCEFIFVSDVNYIKLISIIAQLSPETVQNLTTTKNARE